MHPVFDHLRIARFVANERVYVLNHRLVSVIARTGRNGITIAQAYDTANFDDEFTIGELEAVLTVLVYHRLVRRRRLRNGDDYEVRLFYVTPYFVSPNPWENM